jgi:hypothetical protein
MSLCLAYSQKYLSDLDSSLLYLKDTVRPFLKRFENLQFSGYIQPQFQADTEGVDHIMETLPSFEEQVYAAKGKGEA